MRVVILSTHIPIFLFLTLSISIIRLTSGLSVSGLQN